MYARREERRHLLGAGHPGALARHRQRPGLIHLALLTGHIGRRGHRAEPAARAEQRAGRFRCGRDALALPRLPAGRRRRSAREMRAGLEHRAGRAEPCSLGLTTTEILSPVGPGRRARPVHHGREPDDVRAQPQPDPPPHGAAGVPGGAGSVHQRIGRLCRRVPAGGLLGGEGRHLHQHRPARAARAPGHAAARPDRAPTGRSSATWRSASSSASARPTAGWDYAGPVRDAGGDGPAGPRVRRRALLPARGRGPADAGVGREAPRHALPVRRHFPARTGEVLLRWSIGRRSRCRTTSTHSS